MSYTIVKWLISPRKFGIPRTAGTFSRVEDSKLKEIPEGYYEVVEKEKAPKVKDTMAQKSYTRPVTRGKKDS